MAKKKTTTPITGPIYLVQELVREVIPDEYLDFIDEIGDEGPGPDDIKLAEGWAPVKAFRDKSVANAYCVQLESKRRTKENPFRRGKTLKDWSHFDAPQLHDWLLDAGLEPPKKKKFDADVWRDWWDTNAKKMTALQRAKVWEALDRVRFVEVVELTE